VVAVTGDADVSAAGELKRAIDEAASSAVTVDLSEATLLDSRTIAVLVDCTARLRTDARDLIVLCAEPNILSLFRRIGLEDQLTIVASHEAAAETVRARRS
jgi:anti-anti-sigma factor